MTGAAAAGTGAEPSSAGDSEFGSPQPGSEFSPERPMEGDLGGDEFDVGQTGKSQTPSHPALCVVILGGLTQHVGHE